MSTMARPATESDTLALGEMAPDPYRRRAILVNGKPVKMRFSREPEQEMLSLPSVMENVVSCLIQTIAEDTGILFPADRLRALFDPKPV